MNRLLTLTLAAVAVAAFTASSHAALILSQSPWTGDVDVTAEGTVDWVVWDTSVEAKNTEWTDPLGDARVEKSGGTAIGALSTLTTDNAYTQLTKDNGGDEVVFSWTADGDPTASGSAGQGFRTGGGGSGDSSLGHGFSFDVTAGPGSQTLYVYTGIFSAGGTFTAILKDGGGNEIVSDFATLSSDKGVWEVTFSDPSAAMLTLEWENTSDNGDFDNVQLFAATLVPEPATLALIGLGGAMMLAGRKRRA